MAMLKVVSLRMKILLQLILLAFAFVSNADGQDPLYIGSAFEPPISRTDQTGMVDLIVRQAFDRIGKNVFITHLPAERSLLNASMGINDGDLIRVEGLQKHYPDLIKVNEKLIDFEFVAFSKDSQIHIDGWHDLSRHSVGIVRGWKILEEKAAHALLTQVDSLALLFTLLEKGRADVVIYERLAGEYAMRSMTIAGVYLTATPLEIQPMYLYLHRAHSDLVDPLVSALKEMKQDGTYQRIIAEGLEALYEGGSW
jgi:polar amino acid transport system substrate-binding protein